MPRVPTTREVVPGAPVNIILKADQSTGRTVSGTIADVLTRGNHPRGIKVRLTDGRGQRTRRTTSEAELPSQNIGLDAYMVSTRPRRGARRDEPQQPVHDGSVVTCPVCGVFEGDETAVAHHVAGHFAD
ncbi:hypothetical protein F9C07_4640 [Aspergillus flavus]|uniref:Uncharacterized protein n=2 Tax=Aspergillus flavus TaxID=5059 RepID=A0A7U2MKV0_ASPFN|nr:hypothetical protein NYO67_5438 [Aspergillus flavus]QRD85609.1 hypothetical protein F9C07_4640 [Aspergillus flavus]RAQ41745.1 hypothetical protein AFGD_001256 [Aspergillus flavus]RAQ70776.1 hypothetical protein COH20_000975 [Aspergillus flavus]RAQ81579.1 hypothetical protein COH21_006755 [Aspergillus flavus]